MKETEIKLLFAAIEESSKKDNVITLQDIRNYVGVDLDNDGVVSDFMLYRKLTQGPSIADPTKIITYYTYSSNFSNETEAQEAGYEKYMVDGIQQSENMLTDITNNAWKTAFEEALTDDDEITYAEFREYLLTPVSFKN
tara:strand:- start:957 stop:1373 length:417 start_codon:yes stop_codon:yes gene_type:complete